MKCVKIMTVAVWALADTLKRLKLWKDVLVLVTKKKRKHWKDTKK